MRLELEAMWCKLLGHLILETWLMIGFLLIQHTELLSTYVFFHPVIDVEDLAMFSICCNTYIFHLPVVLFKILPTVNEYVLEENKTGQKFPCIL